MKIIEWLNKNPGVGILLTFLFTLFTGILFPFFRWFHKKLSKPTLKIVVSDGTAEGRDTISLNNSNADDFDASILLKIYSSKNSKAGYRKFVITLGGEFNRSFPRNVDLENQGEDVVFTVEKNGPLFKGLNPVMEVFSLRITNPVKNEYEIPWLIYDLNESNPTSGKIKVYLEGKI